MCKNRSICVVLLETQLQRTTRFNHPHPRRYPPTPNPTYTQFKAVSLPSYLSPQAPLWAFLLDSLQSRWRFRLILSAAAARVHRNANERCGLSDGAPVSAGGSLAPRSSTSERWDGLHLGPRLDVRSFWSPARLCGFSYLCLLSLRSSRFTQEVH